MDPKINQFKNLIKQNHLCGFLVTNPTNIFYLTGFRGVLPSDRESILVFNLSPTLITARIYQNEAKLLKANNLSVKIVNERNQIFEYAHKLLKKCQKVGLPAEAPAKVGFEASDLKFGEYKLLTGNQPPGTGNRLIPFNNLVEGLRTIKTEDEIQKIERAQRISQKAFDQLVKTIKVGQTEDEIASRLTKIVKSLDTDALAFESIVACGKNASLPHYITGKTKVKKTDILLFDFGARYRNYCADLSRTIFIGKITDQQRNIYNLILTAQKSAINKITEGIKASNIYHCANNIFKKEKLHPYFLHGLGHGVGLNIHESPYLRPTIHEPVLKNMVFSIEPGLYFPNYGIRIEDLVVIQKGRAKVLGKLTEAVIKLY